MSLFTAPYNLYIFPNFDQLISQMQRAINHFFPSSGTWRIWKYLVFGQAFFILAPPPTHPSNFFNLSPVFLLDCFAFSQNCQLCRHNSSSTTTWFAPYHTCLSWDTLQAILIQAVGFQILRETIFGLCIFLSWKPISNYFWAL